MPLTVQPDTERALHKWLARAGISKTDVQSGRLADIDEVLEFHSDEPPSTFIGFGGQQILHTSVVLYSTDDSHIHRIERCGRWLVHCEIERTDFDGTYRLAGRAVLAERGSTRERAFVLAALQVIATDAAQPLRNLRVNAEQAGLPIDAAIAEAVASLAGSAESGPTEKASDEEVNRARRLYADDNVQIDDGAVASRGDGITWVQAWVALEEQRHE